MTLKEKTEHVLNDVNFKTNIFNHIVNGGNAVSYCEESGISYHDLIERMNNDIDLQQKLDRAFRHRREHMAEKVINEIHDMLNFKLSDLYDEEGNVKKILDMPHGVQKAIKSIDKFLITASL